VTRDFVDHLTEQWARERPELDTRALRVGARVVRLQRFLHGSVGAALAAFGLTEGESNVLATLRRSGPPFELTPTELYRGLLVSSGAMTNRLDRLEERGLVERIPDDADRRRIRVALTPTGRALIDETMDAYTAALQEQLDFLSDDERRTLEASLRLVLTELERAGLEPPGPDGVSVGPASP
jgi:DNA-binding MarR family transcriptional regulator